MMALLTDSMPVDLRVAQADCLWTKGIVPEDGMSFSDYLATIPAIPEDVRAYDERFPQLINVDARLGVAKICELLGIEFGGNDQTFTDLDPAKARTEKVYWVRCQDGRKYRDRSVLDCRDAFAPDETGLVVHEGLALFVQNPEAFRNCAVDFVGSVYRGDRAKTAYLYWFSDRPELLWRCEDRNRSIYGSASRRA